MTQENVSGSYNRREAFLAFESQLPLRLPSFIKTLERLCLLTESLAIRHDGEKIVVSVPDLSGGNSEIIALPSRDGSYWKLIKDEFREKAHLPSEENTINPQEGRYIIRLGIWSNISINSNPGSIKLTMSLSSAQTAEEACKEMLDDLNPDHS